jgi:peptidyl-prolyl cis-trans isomerase SurA
VRAAALAVALLWVPLASAATEILDQVVAIVDDDVVLASELRERLGAVTANLQARGMELPPEDVLIRETLDRLILESIQLQMGRRAGVRISDAQLNQAVQRLAASSGMTLEQFRAAMEAEGRSYNELRDQIYREIVIQRVQAGNVNQRVQITPQEVDNYLATEEGRRLVEPEYRLIHALLPLSTTASSSEVAAAEAHIKRLLRRIRAGEPFDQVMRSGSTPSYRLTGGDLGWRGPDDLPSLFADVAPTLRQGETSDPIRSDSGFHLVYMAARRGGTAQVVPQTHARHILVKTSEIMSEQQALELVTELRARAQSGEAFADLARQYSEDIGSAQEGGDLGWTNPGQMVPEFEKRMAETAVGEISQPVRSQFGWHIIEVLERREQDMTEEAVRAQAMDLLHQRKFQEELEGWLRRIRDEAFVDIK